VTTKEEEKKNSNLVKSTKKKKKSRWEKGRQLFTTIFSKSTTISQRLRDAEASEEIIYTSDGFR